MPTREPQHLRDPDTGEVLLEEAERQRCEVWTRVMGYFRPVSAWNAGKQAEYHDRRPFRIPASGGLEEAQPPLPFPANGQGNEEA